MPWASPKTSNWLFRIGLENLNFLDSYTGDSKKQQHLGTIILVVSSSNHLPELWKYVVHKGRHEGEHYKDINGQISTFLAPSRNLLAFQKFLMYKRNFINCHSPEHFRSCCPSTVVSLAQIKSYKSFLYVWTFLT